MQCDKILSDMSELIYIFSFDIKTENNQVKDYNEVVFTEIKKLKD